MALVGPLIEDDTCNALSVLRCSTSKPYCGAGEAAPCFIGLSRDNNQVQELGYSTAQQDLARHLRAKRSTDLAV